MDVTVKFQILDHARDLPAPAFATALSAGADIRAAIPDAPLTLAPFARHAIPTGLKLSMPGDIEAQIRPRSGLALKHGLTLLNSPGTIDPDYRGEIKVILINLGTEIVTITHGDRIAQMVFAPLIRPTLLATDQLDATIRGIGGFGSTGVQ